VDDPVGMLDLESLGAAVQADEIDTVVVGFTDHYGRLVGKRFDADFFVRAVAEGGTHGCDYLLTVDMEMSPVDGYEFANWELGYGDFHLVPDLSTLRNAAWLDKTALVICDVHDQATHSLVPVAPRTILRTQIERARDLGFEVMGASELEFYTYDEPFRAAAASHHADLTPSSSYIQDYHLVQPFREAGFTTSMRRSLRASGVPVESTKGEWGRGQHEINVEYTDALAMADRHVVLKQCAKETAIAQDMSITFMAKPHTDEAGSSCHLHLSLWRDGQNAFAATTGEGETPLFRHFLGGWLGRVPEVLPMYAPTVNSYKRFQDASWAPTKLAWSHDNRTAAMRVVGSGSSLRIECRVPGADCNPYLAFAAAIASGLDGIANEIEPPEPFAGDVYASDVETLATTLRAANQDFSESAFAAGAFGEDVVRHYSHFFATEQAASDGAVTDWERDRYFSRI
jgi:glutamine synthetase